VSKWYVDCIGDGGECAIAYHARLSWGPIALGDASLLRDRRVGTRHSGCYMRGGEPDWSADRPATDARPRAGRRGAPDRCAFEPAVRAIAKDHLARITSLRDELLSEAVTLY
jgi:hypothetical protein